MPFLVTLQIGPLLLIYEGQGEHGLADAAVVRDDPTANDRSFLCHHSRDPSDLPGLEHKRTAFGAEGF